MSALSRVMVGIAMVTAATFAYFWDDLEHLYYNKTSKPVSVADAYCAHLWVARAQNDRALDCYLTQKIERLCNPIELVHLAWTLREYENDRTAFAADLAAALLSVQVGYYSAQKADPKLDGLQAMAKSQSGVAEKIKSSGGAKAWKMDVVPKRKLIADIRALAERGYIKESDFGWWPAKILVSGFKDVVPAKSPCPS